MTKYASRAAAPATTIKARRTRTAEAAAPKHEQPLLGTEDEGSFDHIYQDFLNAKERLLAALKAPSWKRIMAATVVSLLVGIGVGWFAGFAIDFLTLGVLSLTGSAYAGMVMWFFGVIATLIGAGKLGAMAWDAVMSGRVEEFCAPRLSAVKCWVAGKFAFGRNDAVAA